MIWAHFRVPLDSLLAYEVDVGLTLGHLGSTLGSLLAYEADFGMTLEHFGIFLGSFWSTWGPLWGSFGIAFVTLGSL